MVRGPFGSRESAGPVGVGGIFTNVKPYVFTPGD